MEKAGGSDDCGHWILQFLLNRIDFSFAQRQFRAHFTWVFLPSTSAESFPSILRVYIYIFYFFLDFRFVVRQLSKKFPHVCASAAAASKMSLFFA